MATAAEAEPARVLLLGDSVTQGSDGDYTWRYFAWNGLRRTGADVDFVGPYQGTNAVDGTWQGGYADPAFDQDHAARWGLPLWESLEDPNDRAPRIGDLVAARDPDVVVETLGINDFVWLGLSAEQMTEQVRELVGEARAAKPDVDVVVGAIPQTWLREVEDYNAGLPSLAEELSTPDSRVVTTPVAEFVQGVDTYDPAHPTTAGQVKIAAAVSVALEELGLGQAVTMPLPESPGPRDPRSEPEPEPETPKQPDPEPETPKQPDPEPEPETPKQPDPEPEPEPETPKQPDPEPEPEPETPKQPDPEPDTPTGSGAVSPTPQDSASPPVASAPPSASETLHPTTPRRLRVRAQRNGWVRLSWRLGQNSAGAHLAAQSQRGTTGVDGALARHRLSGEVVPAATLAWRHLPVPRGGRVGRLGVGGDPAREGPDPLGRVRAD